MAVIGVEVQTPQGIQTSSDLQATQQGDQYDPPGISRASAATFARGICITRNSASRYVCYGCCELRMLPNHDEGEALQLYMLYLSNASSRFKACLTAETNSIPASKSAVETACEPLLTKAPTTSAERPEPILRKLLQTNDNYEVAPPLSGCEPSAIYGPAARRLAEPRVS